MENANVETFAMDADQIKAFVFSHMGVTNDSKDVVKKLSSFDRLAVGRYALIQFGGNPDMTDEERAEAIRQGEEYYNIFGMVNQLNYFADK